LGRHKRRLLRGKKPFELPGGGTRSKVCPARGACTSKFVFTDMEQDIQHTLHGKYTHFTSAIPPLL